MSREHQVQKKSSQPDFAMTKGHRSRVRERFRHNGFDGMYNYEVMEALLMLVLPRKDVKPLAKRLLAKYGSVTAVLAESLTKLENFPGLGSSSAVGLKMILGACQYCLWERCKESHSVLNSPELIRDFARMKVGTLHHESYMVIFLNSRHRLIDYKIIAEGTVNSVTAHSRNIVELAVELKASSIVLIHNHPSGVCTPSDEDMLSTKLICDALNFMNISMLDHLIVSSEDCFSFAANGLSCSKYTEIES